MGRPPKQGIQFAGWDVDMFEDDKIVRLVSSQGWQGFAIFFFICQMAYRTTGYYLRWTDKSAAFIAESMGRGIKPRMVTETVNACVRLELFDKEKLDMAGILTSHAIQERFVIATNGRRVRTACQAYWVLGSEESAGMKLVPLNNPTGAGSAALDADAEAALPDEDRRRRKGQNAGTAAASEDVKSALSTCGTGPRKISAEDAAPVADVESAPRAETEMRKPGKRTRKRVEALDADAEAALPDDSNLQTANARKSGICNEQINTGSSLQPANNPDARVCSQQIHENGSLHPANSSETAQNDHLQPANSLSYVEHNLITQRERERKGERTTADCSFLVPENPFGDTNNQVLVNVDPLVYYARNNLIYISENQEHELVSFRDSLPDELIIHCIDEACGTGRRTYFYAKAVMNRCVAEGIKTVGEFEAQKEAARLRRRRSDCGPVTWGPVDEDDFI